MVTTMEKLNMAQTQQRIYTDDKDDIDDDDDDSDEHNKKKT